MLLELLHVDKSLSMSFELKIYFFNKNNSWFRVFFFLNILNMLHIFFWHKVLLLKGLMIIFFLSCKSYVLCSLFSKYIKDIFLSSLLASFLSFLILSFSCNFSGICWRSYGLFSLWHCLPFHMRCYSFLNFRKLQDLVFILFLYVGFYFLSSSTVLMLKILPVFNIFNFPWILFSFFLVFIVFIFDLLFYLSSIVSISYCYFFFAPCIFVFLFSFISNYFQSMGPHIWTFLALIYIVSFISCSIFLMFLC